jgi:Zn-dependent protease with chaperone function
VLELGLPLLCILDDQEKLALLAHELAHDVNRDATRGVLVGSAMTSLSRWYAVMRPVHLALSLGFTELIHLYALLLSHLCWRDAQRAEYLADGLAAQVVGTAAMLSLLDKLHVTHARYLLAPNPADRERPDRFFDDLRERLAAIPPREWERIRRVERLHVSRLDATHPPTAYRIALLDDVPATPPAITLTDDESTALAYELAAAERTAEERMARPKGTPPGASRDWVRR